jgi:hypothetical protein
MRCVINKEQRLVDSKLHIPSSEKRSTSCHLFPTNESGTSALWSAPMHTTLGASREFLIVGKTTYRSYKSKISAVHAWRLAARQQNWPSTACEDVTELLLCLHATTDRQERGGYRFNLSANVTIEPFMQNQFRLVTKNGLEELTCDYRTGARYQSRAS